MTNDMHPAVNQAMDLIHKLAGPMAEEFGLFFGDKARAFRLRNLVDVAARAKQKLHDAGLPESAVQPRLLFPLVESCSVENNHDLQEKWAGLLATASQDGDAVSPSFIETLKQLTPDDVRHLDRIYNEVVAHRDSIYRRLPDWAARTPRHQRLSAIPPRSLSGPARQSAENFERLGLVVKDYDVKTKAVTDGSDYIEDVTSEILYAYFFTQYAQRFIEACRGPAPMDSPPRTV